MNEPATDPGRLLDEAIDLLIRYQNDPDNPVALDMIRAWRARGAQYEEVWVRVSKAHGASGKVLSAQRKMERRENLGLTRRNFMIGGTLGLGMGAAGYMFGQDLMLQARADYMTAKGEMRRIDLPDGSIATLGPASAISLDFQGHRRSVDLLAGMSFFEVTADASRPFSVISGALTATTSGTAFDFSNDADILTVSVEHGLVDVKTSDSTLQASVHISDNQWISVDPSSGDIDRGVRESGQVASWRDKLIIAEREPVSALVARIGRWIPGRILIGDFRIGKQRVSGVFDLSNPLLALRAAVHPTGARVRQISSLVTVISSI